MTRRRVPPALPLAALLTVTAALPAAARAEPPAVSAAAAPATDARAADLLAKAAAALARTETLRADFVTTTDESLLYRDTEERGTVTLARPGSVRIEIKRYRRVQEGNPWEATGNGSLLVADGSSLLTVVNHPASTQARVDAAPASAEALLRSLEPLTGFFSPTASTGGAARYAGRRVWEGEEYDIVEVEEADRSRELYLDSEGLIRRVVVRRFSAKDGGPTVREVVLRNVRRGGPTPAGAFVTQAPAGSLPFERTTPAEGADRTTGLLMAGEVAPDFAAQDADGKALRLSDFKGKTVVLKFWATWCWSCKQSLPSTQEVAKQYGTRDVVVLAVALWDSPEAFRQWVRANGKRYPGVRFAFDPTPQGKDVGSALYRIRTTPTTYVLRTDGTVATAFAGYNGPSPQLARAVEAALTPLPATASAPVSTGGK